MLIKEVANDRPKHKNFYHFSSRSAQKRNIKNIIYVFHVTNYLSALQLIQQNVENVIFESRL